MAQGWSLFIVGLLVIFNGRDTSSFAVDFGDIREILGLGREIATNALESLEWIRKGEGNNGELDFPFIKKMERKLFDKMNTVNNRVQNLEKQIDQRTGEVLDIIMRELPLREKLERNVQDMSALLDRVNDFHNDYTVYYSDKNDKFEHFTLRDFAKRCVSIEFRALPDLLRSIHRLIVPNNFIQKDQSIFTQIALNSQEASAQICNEQQSPQQLLYNLYKVIAITEMKGLMMMQFSYVLLELYTNGTFEQERNKTQQDYESRLADTVRTVRTAMAFAPRDLWRCDPAQHVEESTYAELKQLFQGYIVNEVDLNPTSTCRENCGYYSFSKVHGCYDNLFCAQQRKCKGKILNCQYVDSDMWICPSSNPDRRYEYIEYENGKMHGNKGTCRNPTTKVDSWWRWLFWHCSYCMCYCDDHNASSDRYFSLQNITSDVINNKVITGMRLKKVNQIIHIQIQEGKLAQRGEIDDSTISWQPINNFTILDRDIINGRDFHTLSWEKRAIDLDDLIAHEEHLLTGVRFRMVGAHLNFEIRITPFNYTSGQLIKPTEKSIWIGNDNTDVNDPNGPDRRTEFVINNPDIPTRAKAQTFPDSKTNQYLNFAPTDLEKDVAQTTIPFLDVQPLITSPPSPLAGAGVFHKGRSGYGGFVALKVMTYDFSKHIKSESPQLPLITDSKRYIKDEDTSFITDSEKNIKVETFITGSHESLKDNDRLGINGLNDGNKVNEIPTVK